MRAHSGRERNEENVPTEGRSHEAKESPESESPTQHQAHDSEQDESIRPSQLNIYTTDYIYARFNLYINKYHSFCNFVVLHCHSTFEALYPHKIIHTIMRRSSVALIIDFL